MSVVALDIGTSNMKALLARWDGTLLAVRTVPTPSESPAPGQLAFPAPAVRDAAAGVIAAVTAAQPKDPADTLVLSCLGTAMVPLDRAGRPLGAALSPSDVRPVHTPGLMDGVDLDAQRVLHLTGMDARLTSFLHHWQWWRQVQPELIEHVARFRSLRGFLVHELCGADSEDASWASRTMLLDLETADWSGEILGHLGLPREMLPEVQPATTSWPVEPVAAARFGLHASARVVLGGMDNCCSVLGATATGEQRLVNIVGTYEHLAGVGEMAAARQASRAPFGVLHRHVLPGMYVAMSRVPLGHLLGLVTEAAADGLDRLMEGVSIRPTGERVPLRTEAVREELEAGTAPATVLQRLLESSADVLLGSLRAWEDAGARIDRIVAVGGGAAHEPPLRLKAHVLGRPLSTLRSEEGAGLGALRLAAMAVRNASLPEACQLFADPIARTFRPGRGRAT